MNIIFTSPYYFLWSKDVSEIATLLEAEVVGIDSLLRAEVKSNSLLGNKLGSVVKRGEVVPPNLVSELLFHRFFDNTARKILVKCPITMMHAESLSKYIQSDSYDLSSCIVVSVDKKSAIEKFTSQFHCVEHYHQKLECLDDSPKCHICEKPMVHTYDLKNGKGAQLIDSYFEKKGVLSGAYFLSDILGIKAITYTNPKQLTNDIRGIHSENV
jgi:adenylate kinase family enzyme